MTRPHRTAVGPAPTEVRCGLPSPVGLTNGERRERRQIAGIAISIGALLTSGALALTLLPAGSTLVGRLPDQVVRAVAATEIEPIAPPPRRITVERLGIDADLVNLGIAKDGELEVPEDAAVPGWYRGGPAPGNTGPAVLVGHVDSFEGPGVFFRLRELVPGDRVTVTRVDSSVVTFEVYGSETVPKVEFPTDRVYGGTAGPELRLLTCGGAFDRETRSYKDNVIVYARQV